MKIIDEIDSYIRSRRAERNISPARGDTIRADLRQWHNALGKKRFEKVSREQVEQVIVMMRDDGKKPSTIRKKIGVLQCFARWAAERNKMRRVHPCVMIRKTRQRDAQHKGDIRYVPLWRFVEITGYVESRAPWVGIVMRAMPLLGLRPMALIELRWRHVTMPRSKDRPGLISAQFLKDGPEMRIVVPYDTERARLLCAARLIFRALHGRSARPFDPVFPSYRNRRGWASVSVLCKEVRRHCDAAGFDGTMYWGRHAAITRLHESGTGIGPAMNWAGHERLETQSYYGHSALTEPAFEILENEVKRGLRRQ